MINDALRLVRVFHNINQSKMADLLDITRSYLSEIESGKKDPSISILEKYGEVFDMPASSILLFSEKIEDDTISERTRVSVAKKVIRIMDWLAETRKYSERKVG